MVEHFNGYEVLAQSGCLKNNKSLGLSFVSSELLKATSCEALGDCFAILFNCIGKF